MSLIGVWMKIDLHMKGWAPRLTLKKRPKIIKKCPIRRVKGMEYELDAVLLFVNVRGITYPYIF